MSRSLSHLANVRAFGVPDNAVKHFYSANWGFPRKEDMKKAGLMCSPSVPTFVRKESRYVFKEEQEAIQTARVARTNGDDLRRALDWIVNDEMFADLRLHGNVGWMAASLVRLAVFWAWSAESSLVVAADEAIACVKRVFGQSPVGSYQGLTI